VDITVDVAELLKEYKDNELRGDATYKGKRVRIIGKAGEIKRDLTNAIYLTVGTGAELEIPEAQCFFGDEYAARISSITHGQPVMVNCTVEGLMMNVLMKDCSFPSVAAYNACNALNNAGVAAQCVIHGWKEDGSVPFYTSAPQPNQSAAKAHEFTERALGLVSWFKDDAAYAKVTARLDALPRDAGFRNYVGSPMARIIVILPPAASPDMLPRVKAVVDRLAPASK
jgi:hypothetical protein